MFTKGKLYGSGTLVLICLHIYHLNYIGIQMLQLLNNFNSSLSGCPFYTSVFRHLELGFQCSSIGRPGLNFQIIVSNDVFSQTSFMKSKRGIFMAPAFLIRFVRSNLNKSWQ